MEITKEHAIKFLELCDAGLSKGLGQQAPGQMCVEACWNAALGLPHGDNPPCVGKAVRAANLPLNDANWSSNEARAKGMRAIGVAQAGSDQIDQVEFSRLIAEGLERVMAQYPPADTADAARYTAEAARYTAYAASYTADSDASTFAAASCTAGAARCTAEAASCTASAARCTADEVLTAFAEVILDALKELKSPGCEFLHLLDPHQR